MCVSIVFVLCGARNAATTPPLPVHDGRHPTLCKLLIMQVDTRLRMESIRTLCPIAWGVGPLCPVLGGGYLGTQHHIRCAISEAGSENATVPEQLRRQQRGPWRQDLRFLRERVAGTTSGGEYNGDWAIRRSAP